MDYFMSGQDSSFTEPMPVPPQHVITRCGDYQLHWGTKTYVMGVLNVTPDSFSGDGMTGVEAAVARAERFVADGADIIDVGGESTRPGAAFVSEEEERARVEPVIRALAPRVSVPISIDTSRAPVAEAAIGAGATMVNDVWGLRRDPKLAGVVARTGVALVLMHNRAAQPTVDALGGHYDAVAYTDVMAEIIAWLGESVALAERAGVARSQIVVDPGIGFGKTAAQNLEVMRRLPELSALGLPILVGTSRKSFIGITLGLPVEERLEGTAATVALAIAAGADIVRVHDVRFMSRVARMADAIVRSSPPAPLHRP
jgi:dihydropteroate synthase